MNDKLKNFVQEHREEFDVFEPSPQVWTQIEKKLPQKEEKPKGIVITMRMMRWAAAAVVIGFVSIIGFNYLKSDKPVEPNNNLAQTTPPAIETPKSSITPDEPVIESPGTTDAIKTGDKNVKSSSKSSSISYGKQIEDYSNQISKQTSSLKKISVGNPGLYEQFNKDLKQLQDAYEYLSSQMSTHPNKDKLLTAMVQNLQLQSELLKRQIQIANNINNNKKNSYENASKS